MNEEACYIADELNFGDVEASALREMGVEDVGELSPHGRFMLAGCVAYADWVANDRYLSRVFVEGWQEATGCDWHGLSSAEKAEVLVLECGSHHRADVDLVSDDFTQRMTECIGEASDGVARRAVA
mgnify:CR=1 FL=1